MAVLPSMRQREARRILETVRCAMHDFCHHRQGLDRARPQAGRQQEIREVGWPSIGRGCQRAVQTANEDIFRTHIVMRRHDQMRQFQLSGWLLRKLGKLGPPPMKWSDSKYGFATEEDWNGEEAQTGRDRCEVAAS